MPQMYLEDKTDLKKAIDYFGIQWEKEIKLETKIFPCILISFFSDDVEFGESYRFETVSLSDFKIKTVEKQNIDLDEIERFEETLIIKEFKQEDIADENTDFPPFPNELFLHSKDEIINDLEKRIKRINRVNKKIKKIKKEQSDLEFYLNQYSCFLQTQKTKKIDLDVKIYYTIIYHFYMQFGYIPLPDFLKSYDAILSKPYIIRVRAYVNILKNLPDPENASLECMGLVFYHVSVGIMNWEKLYDDKSHYRDFMRGEILEGIAELGYNKLLLKPKFKPIKQIILDRKNIYDWNKDLNKGEFKKLDGIYKFVSKNVALPKSEEIRQSIVKESWDFIKLTAESILYDEFNPNLIQSKFDNKDDFVLKDIPKNNSYEVREKSFFPYSIF